MSQRIVIGIQPPTDWVALKKELASIGAESVTEPTAAQPDVIVATVPSEMEAAKFLEKAKKLRGVRYAELDAWRFTM